MLVLPPELTHRQAAACLRMLMQGLLKHRGDPTVVVDAHALRVFDTSALAVLLECRREALALGKLFRVQGLPESLMGMAGVYGVDQLMESRITLAGTLASTDSIAASARA